MSDNVFLSIIEDRNTDDTIGHLWEGVAGRVLRLLDAGKKIREGLGTLIKSTKN